MSKRDSRWTMVVCVLALALVIMTAGGASAQSPEQDAEHPHDAHVAAGAHGEAPGEEHAAEHEGDHEGGFHLENIVTLVVANIWGTEVVEKYAAWLDPIYSLLVAAIIAAFFITVGRGLRDRSPTRRQMFAEAVIGSLYNMFEGVLGNQARRFAPYLGTLFIFILCNNLFGLIPLGHSSTASFVNTTLVFGLFTFIYVQYVGIKENGIGGYLYHFAGQPRSGIEWGFAILIFPLELMGELIKPISLSLRLFGNIFGEDTLIAVMVVLGMQLMHFILGLVGAGAIAGWFPGLPLQVPFYAIALIGSTVQALVFTLLSTIYISLMLPHEPEEAH